MENMFCWQCEQTAKGEGCTVSGVCGKKPPCAAEQDLLTCEMASLAAVSDPKDKEIVDLLTDGLFTCVTNVDFDENAVAEYTKRVKAKREEMGAPLIIEPQHLFHVDKNQVSLRSLLLFGLRGMSAYAHNARDFGARDEDVDAQIISGLAAVGAEHSVDEWLDLIMKFGQDNFKCMQLLDSANTSAYGNPTPAEVSLKIEKGPFIVITGHDLKDLKMLLDQTDGTGVNVYTHCEMLPAHGYPELRKYKHLKGNFGTAWQNQQKEFDNIPAPILFTTNCLMPPKDTYRDRVYTTSVVGYPNVKHISEDENGNKDFSEMIAQAKELGGYVEDVQMAGINGGPTVTTGYARQTVLDNAQTIIDAARSGAIKHFYLVGGCDGAKPSRKYYTEFVKNSPEDTIILTLACGKFRFNDLDIGKIGPFPRILDMGQCNDAYGAIVVALALADAFGCGVNELPLSMILSWYEQKAVCILLTLLSLGVKNIYLGPDLPAFVSPDVLSVLSEKFNLQPTTTPEEQLKETMGE